MIYTQNHYTAFPSLPSLIATHTRSLPPRSCFLTLYQEFGPSFFCFSRNQKSPNPIPLSFTILRSPLLLSSSNSASPPQSFLITTLSLSVFTLRVSLANPPLSWFSFSAVRREQEGPSFSFAGEDNPPPPPHKNPSSNSSSPTSLRQNSARSLARLA